MERRDRSGGVGVKRWKEREEAREKWNRVG